MTFMEYIIKATLNMDILLSLDVKSGENAGPF